MVRSTRPFLGNGLCGCGRETRGHREGGVIMDRQAKDDGTNIDTNRCDVSKANWSFESKN